MKIQYRLLLAVLLIYSAIPSNTYAGEVSIIDARLKPSGADQWNIEVTLKHADTGWEHYADAWRVLDAEGHELGRRVLYHPHVNEQPFTRSLSNVEIPVSVSVVYIEAHDKVHGWAADRKEVMLKR